MSVNSKMKAIADAIREKTGGTGKLNLDQMAIGVNDVYQAGYSGGRDVGSKQGAAAEYNRFWNALQNNGAAMDYTYAFAGTIWDDDCYNPKYTIKATVCTNMFRNAAITDVKVPIDLSNGTGTHVLNNCQKLVRIPEIIPNINIAFTGWLVNCKALEEIYFGDKDGEQNYIGKSISFASCPLLTAGSINSICNHLSPNVSGQTITFNKAAKETFYNANKTAFDNADLAWAYLCEERPLWTFVLS